MLSETIENNQNQQDRGRTILILMLIFFIVPIVVVVMMFKLNWKPAGESIGHLIKPAQQITSPIAILQSDDSVITEALWQEKWSVVYIAENCEATCYAKLKDMRQLHVSLYKDIMRTQRVLITKTTALDTIKRDFPDMIILNQPNDAVDAMVQQFKVDEYNPAVANRFYFVDPLGFLMMRYQPDVALASVRKDLKRLLKFSWAG